MEKLLIGEILKPQGIRGEVKMKNFTDGFSSVSGLKTVYIGDTAYEVLKMRCDKDVYIFLKGIYDRDGAEKLRGLSVYADKDSVFRGENKYFICDVIGCEILFDGGERFGQVEDILSARTDIYYIDTEKGRAIVPWLSVYNAKFDIENRRIIVDKEAFLKEVNYEN